MKSIFLALAMVVSSVSVAAAARLSGQEVAAMLGAGPVEMVAGSILTAQPGGRGDFSHPNGSSEAGPMQVMGNGEVSLLNEANGQQVRFYFDRARDGRLYIVHTRGQFRGERYQVAE